MFTLIVVFSLYTPRIAAYMEATQLIGYVEVIV